MCLVTSDQLNSVYIVSPLFANTLFVRFRIRWAFLIATSDTSLIITPNLVVFDSIIWT